MDAETPETAPHAKPDRTLLAILIAVGLLVVIALVVVLVRGSAHTVLDASTPEGVVQRYAQAVIDGDDVTTAQYLESRSEDCQYYEPSPVKVRLAFRSTDIHGDRATVLVTVTSSYYGGFLGSGEYSNEEQFVLAKSGGHWLIVDTPYEFLSCAPANGE